MKNILDRWFNARQTKPNLSAKSGNARIPMPKLALILLILFSVGEIFAEDLSEKENSLLSIEHAIYLALQGNPNIGMQRERYNAQAKIPDQSGALPEPRLMLNAANLPLDSFSLTQTPMTQIQLGISQVFPFPGKLALQKKIAENESLASQQMITATQQTIIKQVKHLWWQLFYLDRSLETIERNLNLLIEFIDVVETKYTVGKGLQQEVLLAHVEFAKLEDSQLQIEGLRSKTLASFNVLLNREAMTKVALPKNVSSSLPQVDEISQMIETALASRPEMHKTRLQILAAKERVALSEKAYRPDFQLAALYGWRQDQTGLASVQFSMNLPFNTEKRQDKSRDQRKHEWLEQKYALQALQNAVTEEIYRALADYERAGKQIVIYQDRILPQARLTVDSMLVGYQVNKVDFLNLLRSQMNLFNFQTQYWQALSEANQALAALDYAIGKKVDDEK